MAAPNRLGTTPSFRSSPKKITEHTLQQPATLSYKHPSQQDSYQEHADPWDGCWRSAPVAKLLLPPFHTARNSLVPPLGFLRFPCCFQVSWPPRSDALDWPGRLQRDLPGWRQGPSPAFCCSHTNWLFHGNRSANRPGDVSSGLLLETSGYGKPTALI